MSRAPFYLPPQSRITNKETRNMNSPRPPTAHTHRKPITITAQMIFANRKRDAVRLGIPTHYGTPRPIAEDLARSNARLASTGKPAA